MSIYDYSVEGLDQLWDLVDDFTEVLSSAVLLENDLYERSFL